MSSEDKRMSTILIDLWTSFATNGTPDSPLINEEWRPYRSDNPDENRYLLIREAPAMMKGEMPFYERLKFVKQLLTTVVEDA